VNCTGCGKRLRRHEQDNGLCDACDRLFIESVSAGEQTTIGEALDRAQARVRELEEAKRQINAHSSRVEAELAEAREALRLAATLLERADFDAHDREWARECREQLRASLSASEQPGSNDGD
jgi:hypothetical protein